MLNKSLANFCKSDSSKAEEERVLFTCSLSVCVRVKLIQEAAGVSLY